MVNDLLYKEILEKMEEYKNKINYNTIGTEILLLTLMNIEDSMTYLILKELNVTEQKILNIINDFIFIRDQTKYTNTLKDVFKKAKEFQEKKEYVYDEPYLYALLEEPNNVAMDILKKLEIKNFQIKDELENALSYLEEDDKMLSNLTRKAKNNELNKFIGRSYYINEIDLVLSKKQKNNCMLIGPAGVGKSGAVEGLAYKYLKNKPNITIYELDLGNLIAGTRYRGDLEEKLMDTLDSIKGDNNILFIDEIHNILNNSNSDNTMDIANLLKPFLARSKIKCIGATTIDEYHKTISKDKALARRFKNIYIEEPSNKEVFKILKELKKDYEKYFNVLYSDNIIKYIINSSKYLHNLNNPDKSIDILDESGAITKQRNKSKVSYNIIKEVVFNSLGLNRKLIITKLIKSSLDNNLKIKIEKYLNLNTKKYIFNIEINEKDKLRIIRSLKNIFNINNENILEIDLADYNNDIHSSTLLGSSPGYVGYEDSGLLSKQILRHSINLIIFKNYDKDNLVCKRIIDKIINNGYIYDNQTNKLNFINSMLMFIKNDKNKIGF